MLIYMSNRRVMLGYVVLLVSLLHRQKNTANDHKKNSNEHVSVSVIDGVYFSFLCDGKDLVHATWESQDTAILQQSLHLHPCTKKGKKQAKIMTLIFETTHFI